MKNIFIITAISLLIFACGGGGSHSGDNVSNGETTTIDYEDIEIYPIDAKGCFAGYSNCAYDGNEQTYANVYHPTFKSCLKIEFPFDDYGIIKDQEFWVLLHGNGHDVTVKQTGGLVLGTVNPPKKGWFRFRSTSTDWSQGIEFFCPAGIQVMVYEIYKVVTYNKG